MNVPEKCLVFKALFSYSSGPFVKQKSICTFTEDENETFYNQFLKDDLLRDSLV